MSSLEELIVEIENSKRLDKATKEIIVSLLKDMSWLDEQINELRKYPRYIVDKSNPLNQKKLAVHDLIKDYQAQKDDIATKILKAMSGEESGESPLLEMLQKMK